MVISVSICVLISSTKDTSPTRLRSTHITSFYHNCLWKGPVSKYSPIRKYWGLRLQRISSADRTILCFLNLNQFSSASIYNYLIQVIFMPVIEKTKMNRACMNPAFKYTLQQGSQTHAQEDCFRDMALGAVLTHPHTGYRSLLSSVIWQRVVILSTGKTVLSISNIDNSSFPGASW